MSHEQKCSLPEGREAGEAQQRAKPFRGCLESSAAAVARGARGTGNLVPPPARKPGVSSQLCTECFDPLRTRCHLAHCILLQTETVSGRRNTQHSQRQTQTLMPGLMEAAFRGSSLANHRLVCLFHHTGYFQPAKPKLKGTSKKPVAWFPSSGSPQGLCPFPVHVLPSAGWVPLALQATPAEHREATCLESRGKLEVASLCWLGQLKHGVKDTGTFSCRR